MKVVGIGGQMRAGKDTLADYLITKLSDEWERMAFAWALKDTFAENFDVSREWIEEWKVKDEIPPGFLIPVRQGLQFVGDGFRKIKPTIWLDKPFREDRSMCISDVRYINEIDRVKDSGGVVIVVWRPGFENDDPNGSEAEIKPLIDWYSKQKFEGNYKKYLNEERVPLNCKKVDLFITNDGSLEDLHAKVDNIVVPYINRKWPNNV